MSLGLLSLVTSFTHKSSRGFSASYILPVEIFLKIFSFEIIIVIIKNIEINKN